jgi:hypothetical protein
MAGTCKTASLDDSRLWSSWHSELWTARVRVRRTEGNKPLDQTADLKINLMRERSHETWIAVRGQ